MELIAYYKVQGKILGTDIDKNFTTEELAKGFMSRVMEAANKFSSIADVQEDRYVQETRDDGVRSRLVLVDLEEDSEEVLFLSLVLLRFAD